MVKILTQDKYDESSKGGVVVIDFYADWCMPCKIFAPIIHKVSEEFEQAKFFKVNVDENQQLAASLGIMSIPTVVILSEGKIVEQFSGVKSAAALAETVSKYLTK